MNKQQEPRLRFKGFAGEWKNKTLGDLGRVEMCRRIFKEQTQPSGEIPFFKIGTFGQEPDAFISRELFEEYRQKYPYPKQGDILISAAGTIGRTVEFTGENAYFQDSNIVWLRFDESQITSTFLNITYQNIKWGLEGSTIKRLYNSDLLSAEITLPSLPEQIHLGSFFRRLDSQIAESRAVLEKSRQLKKAMLAKMFPANGEKIPKIRFKGFEGEWECRKLGDLMNVTSVKRIHQSDWTNEGVRFLRARDIVAFNKGERIEELLFISKEKYNEYSELSGKVKIGDLLVTGVGTIGVPYLIEDEDPLYFKDGNVIWFQNENKIGGLFFYYSFLNNFIQDFIIETAGIGTVGTYTIDTGKKTPIFLPPTKSEQTAIGLFFRQLDETIALQSAEVEKLNQLKKGLLAAMLV
jgi:hypothetical protein